MVAEWGLGTDSPEFKMDLGRGAGLGSDTVPLAEQPDGGWDPLQPPRGLCQGLDGRSGGLKHLPKDKLKRHCPEWDGVLMRGWAGELTGSTHRVAWGQGLRRGVNVPNT